MAYEKGITKQNNSKYIDLVGYPLPKLNNPTTTNMTNRRVSAIANVIFKIYFIIKLMLELRFNFFVFQFFPKHGASINRTSVNSKQR